MKRLRELREARRINQQKLAMELNTSQASISKYESGIAEPDAKMIVEIARYFGVTTDYLLENSDQKVAIINNFLSIDEINHLFIYKKLNKHQQELVDAYICGMLEREGK